MRGKVKRYVTMRNLWILLCILGIPSLVSARGNVTTWENLSALEPGQTIKFMATPSNAHRGTFLRVSPTAISLEEKDGEHTIERQDVKVVELPRRGRRLRNTLLGGAIGIGAGAGIGAAVYRKCSSPPGDNLFGCLDFGRSANAAVGAVFGLTGGLVVGAVLPTSKILYRAPTH
jgi:hypothetical protein